ncbi:MAG: phosphopantetheine-binding protein [Sphingopyxis macrogoltabida]|uniref:Phosphopantetheine-binding protein n=1 Tax=Sphingopyxis macrogoltabida TaxID=33050 RepID=A0A2W5KWN7_SPHMC|nr:MAG: phosphopantetheine-binding protein [Sphingopyxis macrogoltabida]
MTDPVTIDRLRADIAAMLEEPDTAFADTDNLIDIGLDSMRAMNLAMQWEEAGVPIDFTDLAEAPSLAEIWAIVRERQGGTP